MTNTETATRPTARVLSATAHHVTVRRLGGAAHLYDGNTDRLIGQADVIRGFAHYTGALGSAHEGVSVVIRGGIDGLLAALDAGVRNGRDDRG